MKRLVMFSLCVGIHSLLLLGPGTAKAQPDPVSGYSKVKGTAIVFSAKHLAFEFTNKEGDTKAITIRPPAHLSANKPVILLVQDINTFREKYDVKAKLTEYHSLSVPGALSGLILTNKPNETQFGGALLEKSSLTPPDGIKDEALKQKANAFKTAVEEYREVITVSLDEVRDIARFGATNEAIRKDIVTYLQRAVPDTVDAKKTVSALVEPMPNIQEESYEDNLEAFKDHWNSIVTVAKALTDDSKLKTATEDVQNAEHEWQLAYKSFLDKAVADKAVADKAVADKAVADKAAEEEAAKKYTDAVVTPLTQEAKANLVSFAHDRAVLRDIYLLVLNPQEFPTRIALPVASLKGDELTAMIKVSATTSPALLPAAKEDQETITKFIQNDTASSSKTFSLTRPIYGRVVNDFSAGGVWTSLNETKYFLGPKSDTDATKIVRVGGKDAANGGVGALAHFYYTTALPMGLTAGPCLGIVSSDSSRLLMGGSLTLNLNRVRVHYSYGAAFGKRTVLNGDRVGEVPLGSSVSTTSRYDWGQFQAVTFGFSF